jgi:hypothetical protein
VRGINSTTGRSMTFLLTLETAFRQRITVQEFNS